jgi:hypothetical protein
MISNSREIILVHRINYSLTGKNASLSKAKVSLERYMYLLTLCSFLEDEGSDILSSKQNFSKWLEKKTGLDLFNQRCFQNA